MPTYCKKTQSLMASLVKASIQLKQICPNIVTVTSGDFTTTGMVIIWYKINFVNVYLGVHCHHNGFYFPHVTSGQPHSLRQAVSIIRRGVTKIHKQ